MSRWLAVLALLAASVVASAQTGIYTVTGGGEDTTCNDAGVTCLFAGSASEGGPATTALALDSDPAACPSGQYVFDVSAAGALSCQVVPAADVSVADAGLFFVATDVEAALQEIGPTMTDARTPTTHAASHESGGGDLVSALPAGATVGGTAPCLSDGTNCPADDTGTDDQTATEVPYTPTTPTDWTDPDPTEAGGALDQIAGRVTTDEAALVTHEGNSSAHHVPTVDTGPSPDCSGTSTYQDGEGGCDTVGGQISGGLDAVTVEGLQFGAAFPVSPATGDVFAVTDDSAVGVCDSAAGSALSLCRWDGTAWVALGDGGGASDSIQDADADTYVKTEASADDDIVRIGAFDGTGVDEMRWDGDGLTLEAATGDRHIQWADINGALFNTWIEGGSTLRFAADNRVKVVIYSATLGTLFQYGTLSRPTVSVYDLDSGLLGDASGVTKFVADATVVGSWSSTDFVISVAQVNTPSSQTCTDSGDASPGALTLSASGTSFVELTSADPDGCDVTLSETGANPGQTLKVWVVSHAGGSISLADTAGVQETGAGCSVTGVHGGWQVDYINSDRWALAWCRASN